jgi:DNA-binding MarR family transcriptional regulator
MLSSSSAPGGDPWPTGTLLAMAARLIEQAWNRRLADLGISAVDVGVLIALEEGPLSQTQLAARCRVAGQTMSRTLDRMEGAGLVHRAHHPTDRRRHEVKRTDQGTTVLRSALHGQPEAQSIFNELHDPERFRNDLLHLIEVLERPTAP